MWHEARKQEKKIRGMLVDYRKRAERRQDFYERIKADPTQFLQVHGRKCKIHLDASVATAAENPAIMQVIFNAQGALVLPGTLFSNVFLHKLACSFHTLSHSSSARGQDPGQKDNLIDRFDVRAHLDYIPPVPRTNPDQPDPLEDDADERAMNYERYRVLAQNEFLGIVEEKYLHQLYLEEQFGVNAQIEAETKAAAAAAKKKSSAGAAIGYTYEETETVPGGSGTSGLGPGGIGTGSSVPFVQSITAIEKASESSASLAGTSGPTTARFDECMKDDSDSDLDMDVSIDINKIGTNQAHELNTCGRQYGMKSNDFYSFLTKDSDEAETLRLAREEEQEKIMFSGRKSRRERRAQRERKVAGRPLSPPSYAAKEELVPRTFVEANDSSRSPSPVNSGKITYITSFGGEEELQPHGKISFGFSREMSTLGGIAGTSKAARLRSGAAGAGAEPTSTLSYADKVKQNLEKLKTQHINDRRSVAVAEEVVEAAAAGAVAAAEAEVDDGAGVRAVAEVEVEVGISQQEQKTFKRHRSGQKSITVEERWSWYNTLYLLTVPKALENAVAFAVPIKVTIAHSLEGISLEPETTVRCWAFVVPTQDHTVTLFLVLLIIYLIVAITLQNASSAYASVANKAKIGRRIGQRFVASLQKATNHFNDRDDDDDDDNCVHSTGKAIALEATADEKKPIPALALIEPEPEVPIKRYYGRRRGDESSSDEASTSGEDTNGNDRKPTIVPALQVTDSAARGDETIGTGSVVGTGSASSTTATASTGLSSKSVNPRDRLKRKMQILLNKQYKADKKAEIEKVERQIQQQQERDDEMRELALKLRRRQRELRHKYGTPESEHSKSHSSDEHSTDEGEEAGGKPTQPSQQQPPHRQPPGDDGSSSPRRLPLLVPPVASVPPPNRMALHTRPPPTLSAGGGPPTSAGGGPGYRNSSSAVIERKPVLRSASNFSAQSGDHTGQSSYGGDTGRLRRRESPAPNVASSSARGYGAGAGGSSPSMNLRRGVAAGSRFDDRNRARRSPPSSRYDRPRSKSRERLASREAGQSASGGGARGRRATDYGRTRGDYERYQSSYGGGGSGQGQQSSYSGGSSGSRYRGRRSRSGSRGRRSRSSERPTTRGNGGSSTVTSSRQSTRSPKPIKKLVDY
uniref:DRY_EERY domain-containing protein n=1 Tax=Anopheles stephensi TaxID=30069 RepID=A0A182Y6K3_ANOST